MSAPIRLTVVQTHPVQYFAPWFRFIHERCPEIELQVLYVTMPSAEQQGAGFGRAFEWDLALTEGYSNRILRPARAGDDVSSHAFWGVDAPGIEHAIRESRPDAVLVPGWHSVALVRALRACRRLGVPAIYRGDTHRGHRPNGLRGLLWEKKTRAALGRFDAYLSVGARARDYLESLGVERARIFDSPHAVDNDFFGVAAAVHQTPFGRAEARKAFGLSEGAFVVLFVGKVTSVKRPLDAIRAVERLERGASFFIVGTGELLPACEEEAKRRGVHLVAAGFLNQSELGRAYAAADCLVLPSESESWGLTVNEALATGLPSVVSDRVGCAPDLVTPGVTGEVFAMGDERALAQALARVRDQVRSGHDLRPACRERVSRYSFDAATRGLLEASRAVSRQKAPRVVLCGGNMVIVSGLERMTFEVLRGLGDRGAEVHCILNSWENHRIVRLAEAIGAGWSTGFYRYRFERRTRNPLKYARMAWDMLRTSAGLLNRARAFRATHVLVPEHVAALRNAPALLLLRALGVPVVLRAANSPERGKFYAFLWGTLLPPLVDRFVAISRFCHGRLLEVGISPAKLALISNAVARRNTEVDTDADVVALARSRKTILAVGQIAPFKGTHLAVEATLALAEAGHDVQAIVVGRLPVWPPDFVRYVEEMRGRAASSRHADRVHFVGERENVLEIMRASYVLAAPILQEETLGNVALEAKSAGLPVVAFPTGGLVETVEHEANGFLCRESSVQGLIEGLQFFLERPDLRRALGGVPYDAERDLRRFHDEWWTLFQALRRLRRTSR